MPTYYLIVYGCQMNKSDAEKVDAVFHNLNYRKVESLREADYLVVVACSVRQTAIDRIWGIIKNLRQDQKSILTGCVLPEDKDKFSDRFDFLFNIKELLALEHYLTGRQNIDDQDYFDKPATRQDFWTAYVPIMTGCNNFCSYCAVPYTRGREVGRSVKSITREVKFLAEQGCKEIIFLGQNVNSFKPQDPENFDPDNPFKHNFAALLWEANQIEGLNRLHFTSAHPKDMSDEVIEALALPKMMNYLHLALQSGNDRILRAMNRQYTAQDYIKTIEKIRTIKPEIAISTDLIVGFPGETEKQFQDTLDVYQKVRFDISYHAMYSLRSGTVSSKMTDNVSLTEKKSRWRRVQELMEKVTYEKNQKYVGRQVSVLIDKAEEEFCEGNSREMKRVRLVAGAGIKGETVKVKIGRADTWMLFEQGI